MHHCLNCSTEFDGNFCPHCGQKAGTHRITFAAILHDIPHSVLHIDKGLPNTFIKLLYKPGKVAADYVSGKRVNYVSPIGYLFILCAVSSFLSHQAAEIMHLTYTLPPGTLFPRLAAFFTHYPALMFCAIIPFIAFWNWLFKLKGPYNYWEHFILNTYLMAQFNVFFILFYIVQLLGIYSSHKVTLMLVFFGLYLVGGHMQFYAEKFSFRNLVLNVLMYLFIVLTLLTGLSVTGFMTRWW